jgi:adenosylhomocysteine nucleosidase
LTPAPPLTEIAGHRILVLMAAEAEFGPQLRARITPHLIGVGPIEAATNTAFALAALARAGIRPDLVLSLGSAGSARLEHCGLYQASAVAWRDMDASALGFAPGVTPFLDLPAILPLPLRLPGIAEATLSTGANIVSGAAYDSIAQDMVDMETFAVLRACMRADLPLIALRGISDGKAELTGLHDWTEYLHIVDERLASAVDTLETALQNGLLAPYAG